MNLSGKGKEVQFYHILEEEGEDRISQILIKIQHKGCKSYFYFKVCLEGLYVLKADACIDGVKTVPIDFVGSSSFRNATAGEVSPKMLEVFGEPRLSGPSGKKQPKSVRFI